MANGNISDDECKRLTALYFSTIEGFVRVAKSHMTGAPESRPEVINAMTGMIHCHTMMMKDFSWPDPKARALVAAQNDHALQKLFKRASRKTPIRG